MEFLAEKSINIWGPWALVVIILMVGIYTISKYFLKRQEKWDAKDEFRTNQFIELERKRSDEILKIQKENTETMSLFRSAVYENTEVLKELKGSISEMNLTLVRRK